MQLSSKHASVAGRSPIPVAISANRPMALVSIGWLLVATVCLGAARLNANVTPAGDVQAADERAVATRLVDFRPNGLAPSAFADWAEADKHAAE